MASRVIEVKPLVESTKTEAAKPLTKGEVVEYLRETKPGAKTKQDPVDALEALLKNLDSLKSTEEYRLKDKPDTDPSDEFKDLTGGVEVDFGPKAKRAYQEVLAALSANLDGSSPKTKAQIYKQLATLEDLFSLLRLKDDDNEYLKPIQREAGDLLAEAISSYPTSAIDPEYREMLVGILDGNPVTSLRNTVDLIRSQGLDKLAKKDSGFFGKLSRSYGQLGKALANHVYGKVHSLLQRPLASFAKDGNVELLDGVQDQVQALKAEVFEKVFGEIKEKSGKQIEKIAREGDDRNFIADFESKMLELFQAEDEAKAATAAHQVTDFLNTRAMRVQMTESKLKRLEALEQSLKEAVRNAGTAKSKTITVSTDTIRGNTELEKAFYDQILAESKALIKEGTKEPEISKEQIVAILEKSRPVDKDSAKNSIAIIKNAIPSEFSYEDITKIIKAAKDDGTADASAKFTTEIKIGDKEITPASVIGEIKSALAQQVKEERAKDLKTAQEIVARESQPDAQALAIASRKTWKLAVDNTTKTIAEKIQGVVKEAKEKAKTDAKYFKKFMDDMAKHIISPIMTKATTINATAARLLMDSMIDSEGQFNAEFMTAFKPQAQAAAEEIEAAKEKAKNDLEAAKLTSSSAASKAVATILGNVGITDYNGFISSLGLGARESEAIKAFKTTLNNSDTSRIGIKLSEDELKYLDTSTDNKASTFDLTRRQLERVRIISSKLQALNEKKDSFAKLEVTASSALTSLLTSSQALVTNLNKTKVAQISTIYSRFSTDHLKKIDKLEKDYEIIDKIDADEANIWDLDSEEDFEGTESVKKILARLKDSVKVGVETVMRFLGFKKTDSAAEFQKRVAAIPSDEDHKGFVSMLNSAAMNMNSKLGSASTTQQAA